MRVIIAGPRVANEPSHRETYRRALADAMKQLCAAASRPQHIISGGARGVDQLGELWAHEHGIPCTITKPDWSKFGKRAGPIRNQQLIIQADTAVVLWNGRSKGTGNLLRQIAAADLPLIYIPIKEPQFYSYRRQLPLFDTKDQPVRTGWDLRHWNVKLNEDKDIPIFGYRCR